MKQLAPLFCLAVLAGLITGCSSKSIVITGLQVEVAAVTRAADGTTQVSWRLHNPNIVSYLVAQTSHRLYLNGTLVGTTLDKEPMPVLPQAKAEHTSRLVPAGAAADRALSEAIAAGTAGYRVETAIVIQLYGEEVERGNLAGAGSVRVTAK